MEQLVVELLHPFILAPRKDMLLEKIVKKKTLADGYMANRRLRSVLYGFSIFYGVQALLIVAATGLISMEMSELSDFAALFNGLVLAPLVFMLVIVSVTYALVATILGIAIKHDLPWLSAVVSMISFLFHLGVTLLLVGSVAVTVYASLSENRVLPPGYPPIGYTAPDLELFVFPSNAYLWAVTLVIVANIFVGLLLLITATSRSLKAFSSTFSFVPGIYEYAHNTRVFSSSKLEAEMNFIWDALNGSRNHTIKSADEFVAAHRDDHLIRFATRNGNLVAAAIHSLPDYELVALIQGDEDRASNVAILLEDSLRIQRLRAPEARGSLRVDRLLEEVAEEQGWEITISDSLMDIRKS